MEILIGFATSAAVATWVYRDAVTRNAPQPALWATGTFLVLIVALPAWLLTRPTKGAAMSSQSAGASRGFKWAIAILGGFVLLVILGVIAAVIADPPPPREARSSARPAAPKLPTSIVRMTADEVYAAYRNNEIAADEALKGNWITVDGTIDNIGKDILGTPYVALSVSGALIGVQAMFSRGDESKLAPLRKGQSVSVRCRVNGKSLGGVLVRECMFEPEA